ncbi:MAG TPA: TolC family outer membrane protein [Methylocystis sp.]|nr:TolC family outer membrane protein [Methylocystis sp.]
MKRRRLVVSAIAAGAASLSLLACAPAVAETMRGALIKTYNNNPDLDEQRANVRVRDEDIPKAAAGWRPKAGFSFNGGPQRVGIKEPEGFDQYGNRAYMNDKYSGLPKNGTFSITQPVFDGWKTTNAVRQAESGVFAARAGLRQAEQQALQYGATAYMNVLRDAAVVQLRKNNITVLQEQLRVTRDRQLFGEVTMTDVAQAEAALAQARSDYAAAQGALENSMANYVQVVGDAPTRLEPAPALDKLVPRSREDAIRMALLAHPNIVAAEHQIDAAEAAVRVAEAALAPTASIGAQVIQTYDSYFGYPNTRQSSGQLLGQLNIPLYQGGGEYAGIRQAKEQLGQARIHADSARFAVRAGVVQAYSQFTTANAAIKFNTVAVKAAETALRGVRDEAAFGQRTTYDVLKAQQDLLNARVNLVTSQRDAVVGSYAVLAAIGRLSLETLNLDAPSYDPGLHYEQVKDKWIGLSTPAGRWSDTDSAPR